MVYRRLKVTFLNRKPTVLMLSLTVIACCLMAFLYYRDNTIKSEVETALQDFNNHPTYEKMKHLQKNYDELDFILKEKFEPEFSLLFFRLRIAERKLALSQWDSYYEEYLPLDEGYFRAYIKQYRVLRALQSEVLQLEKPYKPSIHYKEMLSHIEEGLAYLEIAKPTVETILSEHNLSDKDIDDMPLYLLSGWLNGHNREMPLEIKQLTLE